MRAEVDIADLLAEREAVIERGLGTFLEVGQALLSIRDERLYRQSHDTFEDYCRDRWAISRSRAYQLMSAAKITEDMSTIVDATAPPRTEAQARCLVGLSPQQAGETMAVARAAAALTRGSTDPTASELTETRAHLFGPHAAPNAVKPADPQPDRPPTAAEINARTPQAVIEEHRDDSRRADPAFHVSGLVEELLSYRIDDADRMVRDLPDYARDQLARIPEAIAYLTRIEQARSNA